jgi:hypothetical protein
MGVVRIGLVGSLDRGPKLDLALVVIEVPASHNGVWAEVGRDASLGREVVQLVAACSGQVPEHEFGHCLVGEVVISGTNALLEWAVV